MINDRIGPSDCVYDASLLLRVAPFSSSDDGLRKTLVDPSPDVLEEVTDVE